MTDDPLRNPKDPLRKSGPDQALQLFRALSLTAHGFVAEDVANAAANILINAIRHSHANRADAEARFNELFGRTKSTLLDHYDSVTGKRKSVFPFHQVVRPAFFKDKDGFN